MDDFDLDCQILTPTEQLAARWDKVSYRAQGSPFEDVTVACLAKNTGTTAWKRPGKIKNDTVARYVYLTFDELISVEKLDMKAAKLLVEICEATFMFEEECEELGSFEEIGNQAHAQRMRFVEEFGIYQDYPLRLANLDEDLHALCVAEEIVTFLDLMEFLDRLADKAWIGGSYKCLQNVFAHGDEKGLARFFPFRIGHRGFHLPEAAGFCLSRLSRQQFAEVAEYHERRRKRRRLGGGRIVMPSVVEQKLLPEILECLHYFGSRQPHLLVRIHDSAYLCRELMNLNDPQTEGILHWLIHLALGLFRPSIVNDENGELDQIKLPTDSKICRELNKLVNDE